MAAHERQRADHINWKLGMHGEFSRYTDKGLKKHIQKNLSKELIKLVMGSNPDPDHNLSTTLSDSTILLVNPD